MYHMVVQLLLVRGILSSGFRRLMLSFSLLEACRWKVRYVACVGRT